MADYQVAATRLRRISDRADGFLSSIITRESGGGRAKPPLVEQPLLWANKWQEGETLYRIAIEGHGKDAGDIVRRLHAVVTETGAAFNPLMLIAHEATGCRWRPIPSMSIAQALDLTPQELALHSDDESGVPFLSRCADLVSAVIRALETESQTAVRTEKSTEDQEPGEQDAVGGLLPDSTGEEGTIFADGPSRKFEGGTMVFHPDWVELCGATICCGPRSDRQRKVLDLLCLKRTDGQFASYSSKDLAEKVGLTGGHGAAGLIRDLRDQISKCLLDQVDIDCGREDVIISGNRGYRITKILSVQEREGSE